MDDLKQSVDSKGEFDVGERRQIRVCLVALDAYLLFNPKAAGVQGGTEVDFYMIATELAKDSRFKVSIITDDFGQPDIENYGNITLYKTVGIQKKFLTGVFALWKAMLRADADIYFRQGAAVTSDIVALFCRIRRKIFFLRTAHDLECNGQYLRQYHIRGKTYLWSLKQAKCVFVQKVADVSNLFRTTGIQSVVIPNGHRLADLKGNQRNFVLWVGRSEAFKQPRLFVELARKIPTEQFIMICQRTKGDQHYDDLIRLTDEGGNLKLIRYVPFHDIDFYFQHAKVFVNTSDSEGFPSTFIQAGKCSTPILSLSVNPDGFLDKFRCGICCNGDTTRLVNTLRTLLQEPSRLFEMGNNGRKYVESNHDITKIIEIYKKHFVDAFSEKLISKGI